MQAAAGVRRFAFSSCSCSCLLHLPPASCLLPSASCSRLLALLTFRHGRNIVLRVLNNRFSHFPFPDGLAATAFKGVSS